MQTKIIKQKMKSVANIKKITRTMEMVSVAKMKKAIAKATASRPYFLFALELLEHLAKENLRHLFFQRPNSDRNLVLVIASNKGLCGAYNLNVSKALLRMNQKYKGMIDCLTVGRHAERAALRLNLNILESFADITDNVPEEDIDALTRSIIEKFKSGQYRSVSVVYTEFIRSSKFKPVARELLPLNPNTIKDILEEIEILQNPRTETMSLYLFEPSEEIILDKIIPNIIASALRQMVIESLASEHSSRMFAMKAASDNATEVLKDLSLSYNYARQDGITRELAEIVSGASALETV